MHEALPLHSCERRSNHTAKCMQMFHLSRSKTNSQCLAPACCYGNWVSSVRHLCPCLVWFPAPFHQLPSCSLLSDFAVSDALAPNNSLEEKHTLKTLSALTKWIPLFAQYGAQTHTHTPLGSPQQRQKHKILYTFQNTSTVEKTAASSSCVMLLIRISWALISGCLRFKQMSFFMNQRWGTERRTLKASALLVIEPCCENSTYRNFSPLIQSWYLNPTARTNRAPMEPSHFMIQLTANS